MARHVIATIQNGKQVPLKYENREFKDKVLEVVPMVELCEKATKKGNEKGLTFHEHFVKELMQWFKKDFFRWVDCKPCVVCGGASVNAGSLQPTSEELKYGASRVENHTCSICGFTQRFPRYNDPGKLLETREGRCGEWANCFTGICRTMGYDARFINDTADHVWTEVFCPSLGRWVHLDSCEDAWDRPLVYEQGWKKQITYVIAFSKDEVVDVTYRYTLDPGSVSARRKDEQHVIQQIVQTNATFSHSPGKCDELRKRLAKEMIGMLTKPGVGASESYDGRQSGSVEWRSQRGEIGNTRNSVIDASDATKSLEVRYSPSADEYTVKLDEKPEQVFKGYESLVSQCQGVRRKVEYDWNMVYLARASTEAPAHIEWTVKCKMPITQATITMSHTTFEAGTVLWSCCDLGQQANPQYHANFADIDLTKLVGMKEFRISAKMSDSDWQHTQLFRTEVGQEKDLFLINLKF